MRSNWWRRLTFGVACTLAAVAALPTTWAHAEDRPVRAAADCQWTSADLPLPTGFANGSVSGSDGGNRFSGVVWNHPGVFHGVVWEDGVPHLLGQVNFNSTYISDVNASGTAVGRMDNGAGTVGVRNHDGVYQTLPSMYDAHGINSSGRIVGPGTVRGQVVVWRSDQPANPTILTLPGDEAVSATGIDDAGRVFASTTTGNSYTWSTAGARSKVVPIHPNGWVQVRAINAGTLVGQSGGDAGPTSAVEWDASGQVVRTLPGGVDARGVNANTQVIGTLTTPFGAAAVWTDGAFAGTLTKPANAASLTSSGITDTGVVPGSYTVTGTNQRVPAQWTCT